MLSLFFIFIGLVVAGCSTGEESSSQATNEEGEEETISFIHWRGEDKEEFDEIIRRFEEENPNIKVNMSSFPSDQYEATLQTKLKDGNSGDVFAMFPGVQFETITSAGLAHELSGEEFVSRFIPDYITVGQHEDKQYGLPLQLVFNIPIYNKTLFDKFGVEPPADWEGFLELNETLKENGIERPIIFPAADNGPGQFMNPMMMNNEPDEDIWEKVQSGERKVTEEWWVKTLSQIKELNDKGYFGEDSLGINQSSSGTLFAQENGAILAMGSYMMAQIIEQNPNIELGLLAPITVSEDETVWEGIHTTTFMLAVNEQSEHKEEAKKFIEFLTRPENASLYANGTGQMVTLEDVTYESEVLKAQEPWTEKKTRFQPRYTISNGQVQDAVLASIEAVLSGTEPADAAEQAQKIIDQAL
ncbi:extracellular solute-binding protein [Oceanobacillus piezotolerans]|uniref:Extracellular solute-binding protein n=1 Tax=Oceanobacillus piezotolerans TaxID=2448030 RepID=A0A498D530_9BACI|nr:extracellular solute-binding protein [Oceanobacillus piezotolerans]